MYHSAIMRIISIFANKVACSCDVNCETRISKREVAKKKLITLYNSFNYEIETDFIENKLNNRTIGFVEDFMK